MRLSIFRIWKRPKARQHSTLALGTLFIYLAFLPPGIYSIDGNSMLAVADSLVVRHNTTVPADLGILGRDNQTYSSWYPLQSLLSVPFVALGVLAAHVLHLPTHYVEALLAQILPALCTVATIPFVYLIAKALGGTELGAWLAALTYAFGTIAMVYAREFFAEPLLALLIAAAFYLFLEGNAWLAAALTALAVLAKPTGIIVGLVLSAYLVIKRRSWHATVPAIGSGFGLATYFLYNYYRFGNPFIFGQPWNRFSFWAIPQGVAGLLISPGAGLIWFCPCVILVFVGLARTARRLEALAIMANFSGFVALHSCWQDWSGGWSWGPRYLLPALPGLVALTGVLQGKWQKTLAVLAVTGFLMSAPTLISFYERYYAEANELGITNVELMWLPIDSPLLHAWPAAARQVNDASGQDVRELFRERGAPATTIASSRALRIVAVWWWVLPIVHIPWLMGAGVSIVLVMFGIWLIISAYPRPYSIGEVAQGPAPQPDSTF